MTDVLRKTVQADGFKGLYRVSTVSIIMLAVWTGPCGYGCAMFWLCAVPDELCVRLSACRCKAACPIASCVLSYIQHCCTCVCLGNIMEGLSVHA